MSTRRASRAGGAVLRPLKRLGGALPRPAPSRSAAHHASPHGRRAWDRTACRQPAGLSESSPLVAVAQSPASHTRHNNNHDYSSQSLRAQPPSSPIPEKLGPHAYPSRKAFAPVRIGIRHKVSDRLDSDRHKGLARLVYIYIYICICIYIYIYPSLCLSEPLKDGCGTRFMHVWMRGCIERIDG